MIDFLVDRPAGDPVATLVLAHGAGASMDSRLMARAAGALCDAGLTVLRFEFAYMAARRSGRRPPPPRIDKMVPEFAEALGQVLETSDGPVLIGGKSMGARVACRLAEASLDPRVVGVIAWGFPFHPPDKPEKSRLPDLSASRLPVLICQGERDVYGSRPEIAGLALPPLAEIIWFEDGDHDLVPTASGGQDAAAHAERAASAVAAFVRRQAGGS